MRRGRIAAPALLAVLVLAGVNMLSTESSGSGGPPAGEPLPPFAAPEATSALEGDANVATAPGQGAAGERPACSVRGPDVVSSCALAERGPVVLAFLAESVPECREQVDVVDALAGRHPGVAFAVVAARGDRSALRARIAAERWTVPVAHDRDGAVWNAYAVATCPALTLAGSDGRVTETLVGFAGARELAAHLEDLE